MKNIVFYHICKTRIFVFLFLLIWTTSPIFAQEANQKDNGGVPVLKIYLDADRSHHYESSYSIEMGIKTAFSEVGNEIQGRKVVFVPLDHRANAVRSKMNMEMALSDPDMLTVVTGLHSPPLIKNRSFINENKILTLDPWAAGGPITRYPSADNWIFRLSVDDSKAGYIISGYAIQERHCKAPYLLLEQTPWGESNRKIMGEAVEKAIGYTPPIAWYNWGIAEESSRIKLRNIIETGADCILFVGNTPAGIVFAGAMLSIDSGKRVPFISHWGITGGDFPETVTADIRKEIDLTFIQTCFSFVSSEQTVLSLKVFKEAQNLFPELETPTDLKSPAGFIHAYDLGKILIQALSQVFLTEDMAYNREQVKMALENLEMPVTGLVKRYEKPFSIYSEENYDAHEALGPEDFCMAQYGKDNEIIVFSK